MAKKDALAFVAGFGSGMMSARERKQRQEREEEDRRMRREEHELRIGEAQRAKDDRIALSNAARPVQMEEGAGGMIRPETMDNRDVGLPENASLPDGGLQRAGFRVAGKTFTDRGEADAALEKANSPEAQDARIAQTLRERGNVLGAKQYESASRQSQVSAMDLAERQWSHRLRSSLDRGHEGLADFITNSESGPMTGHRVKAVPTPDGKQVIYHKVNEDGSTTPIPQLTFTNDQEGIARAAYMLDRAVKPEDRYKNMVAEDKNAAAAAAKEQELKLRERELNEVKIPNAETRAQLAEVRASLAQVRASRSSDGVSREERMRYTTLFTDAGRRMQDAQKAINTMRGDRAFMRRATTAGTPEAQQFEEARAQLAAHQEERELYRGLLAGGKGKDGEKAGGLQDVPRPGKSPAGPKARPGASRDNPLSVASAAERDKLPKGAYYRAPNGEIYIKQ